MSCLALPLLGLERRETQGRERPKDSRNATSRTIAATPTTTALATSPSRRRRTTTTAGRRRTATTRAPRWTRAAARSAGWSARLSSLLLLFLPFSPLSHLRICPLPPSQARLLHPRPRVQDVRQRLRAVVCRQPPGAGQLPGLCVPQADDGRQRQRRASGGRETQGGSCVLLSCALLFCSTLLSMLSRHSAPSHPTILNPNPPH